jgi:hypothetical protein
MPENQAQPISIWLDLLHSSKIAERGNESLAEARAAKDEAIILLLGKLALHYWRPDFTPSQAKQLYSDYVQDLASYPLKDIDSAIREYRQGKHRFFPQVGQLISLILGEARLEAENPGAPDRNRTIARVKTQLYLEAELELQSVVYTAKRTLQAIGHT